MNDSELSDLWKWLSDSSSVYWMYFPVSYKSTVFFSNIINTAPELSEAHIVDIALRECHRIIGAVVAAIREKEEGTLWIKINELCSITTALNEKKINLKHFRDTNQTVFAVSYDLGQLAKATRMMKDRNSLIDMATSIMLKVYVEYRSLE